MRSFLAFATVAATITLTSSAFAKTYDFSYAFGGDAINNTVTGSFTGTGGIDDITVDSVLSMSLNGKAVAGPLYFWSYNGPQNGGNDGLASNYTLGSATVSNDSSKSNFVFSTSNSTGTLGASTYFYVIQPWYNGAGSSSPLATQYALGNGGSLNGYNGQYVPANFSVTAVPESSTWAMLLAGFAGLGFLGYRRNKSALLTS